MIDDAEYNKWLKSMVDNMKINSAPKWIGVDWAKDSGMNRGDVIIRDGNVTHVRFKTVSVIIE
jgi:hypothetical protein